MEDVHAWVLLLTRVALQPSLKPFFNLLYTVLKCLMRPVPVVRLRMAFVDQLYRLRFEPDPMPESFLVALCQFDLPLILLIVWPLWLRLPCA